MRPDKSVFSVESNPEIVIEVMPQNNIETDAVENDLPSDEAPGFELPFLFKPISQGETRDTLLQKEPLVNGTVVFDSFIKVIWHKLEFLVIIDN